MAEKKKTTKKLRKQLLQRLRLRKQLLQRLRLRKQLLQRLRLRKQLLQRLRLRKQLLQRLRLRKQLLQRLRLRKQLLQRLRLRKQLLQRLRLRKQLLQRLRLRKQLLQRLRLRKQLLQRLRLRKQLLQRLRQRKQLLQRLRLRKQLLQKSDKVDEKIVINKKLEKQLEEFDWEQSNDFSTGYSKKERSDLEKLYTDSLSSVDEKELIEATVVGLSNRDVVVNIGSKSDGVIPRSEFRDMPELKLNDVVKVYVEEQENVKGQLILSRRKAKLMDAWDKIQKALDNDEVLEGFVKRRTKGGLIVDIFSIETFLPGSQIDVKPIRDYDIYVEKPLNVKIVKINYSNDNVVVSHKMLIEKDLEEQKNKILKKLEIGQVLEGTVKNMTNFGVFVDLGGGIDGLLHITDISWGRVNHPEEVLKLDEKINVVVLDYNDQDKRISLGMKQLTEHPWNSLDENLDVGSVVKGKIVNVADYGAFLELTPGVEGINSCL